MSTKKSLEAAAVAAYRAGAEKRRADTRAANKKSADLEPSVPENAGVITLRKPANAKGVSSLGGPTKAFGTSKFSIPEFKRYKKKRSPH